MVIFRSEFGEVVDIVNRERLAGSLSMDDTDLNSLKKLLLEKYRRPDLWDRVANARAQHQFHFYTNPLTHLNFTYRLAGNDFR